MSKRFTACPGWLQLSPDRSSFVLLPDRADLVKTIFRWSIGGVGAYSIAKRLNVKNIPTFGSSASWDPSTITNMLQSRATFGEFQSKQYRNRKVVSVGDPIRNYYPAAIDEETFNAARAASRENLLRSRGRKGRFLTNLFAGLTNCLYCGAPIKFHSNGPVKSLICRTVLEGRGCHRTGWLYADFETSFFAFVKQNQIEPDLQRLSNSLSAAKDQEILECRTEIAALLKSRLLRVAIASSGRDPKSNEARTPIRRNIPERCCEVQFKDSPARFMYPVPTPPTKRGPKVNHNFLASALNLSPRQAELTGLLVEGLSLSRSAQELDISLETARWHLREVFRRTNTHSQAELVASATRAIPQLDCTFGPAKVESLE